ncbi:hypothetical protein STEG23_003187 [Scotinomys teguina]
MEPKEPDSNLFPCPPHQEDHPRSPDYILALLLLGQVIMSRDHKARVIMPRGQHHARKKHDQARGEAQTCVDAQETAEETPEAVGKSSAALKSQPGAESSSTPKAPQKATPSASSTLSFSTSESQDSSCEESDESEEKECPVEVKPCTIPTHQDVIARKVMVLLQHLLHNYNLKKLTTKEDMLKIITRKYENDFPEIFRKVSEILKYAFAMEVREVNSSEPSSYNLISKLKLPNNGRIRPDNGFSQDCFRDEYPGYHPHEWQSCQCRVPLLCALCDVRVM